MSHKMGCKDSQSPCTGRHLLEPLPMGDLHFPIVLQRDDKDRFVIRALQKKILLSSKFFCKVSKLFFFFLRQSYFIFLETESIF